MPGDPAPTISFGSTRRMVLLSLVALALLSGYVVYPERGRGLLEAGMALAGIGVASYIYGRASWNALHIVEIKRSVEGAFREGEELRVKLEITNPTLLPLMGVEVWEAPPPLFRVSKLPGWVILLPPRSTVKVSYTLTPMAGRHSFGSPTLIVRDPLALTAGRITVTVRGVGEVKVAPRLLGVAPIPRTFTTIPYMGVSARKKGWGSTFYSLREYVPGDETRFIDWKAFARLRKLMIKEYEAEEALQLAIILPVRAGMLYGSPGATIFEAALRMTLSLAFFYLMRGDIVTLIMLDGSREILYGRMLRGKNSSSIVWDLVSRVKPPYPGGPSQDDIDEFLARKAPLLMGSGGYFTIVLTDSEDTIKSLVKGRYAHLLRKSVAGGVVHLPRELFAASPGSTIDLVRLKIAAIEKASEFRAALAAIGFSYTLAGPETRMATVIRRLEGAIARWR
jgi:uncharacterized protein (DUF58 family)